MIAKPNILIVDDEPGVCYAMIELAKAMGLAARSAPDAAAGLAALAADHYDALVLDIQLPGLNGLDALPGIKRGHPDLPVIVVTAHGTMETAVTAVQRGAFEYLLKPVDMDTLKTVLAAAVEQGRQRAQLASAAPPVSDSAVVGRCPAMQEVFKQIALVAATDMAVLIQGETGTGKELVARAIHRYSARSAGPFVAVNCSLLSGELVASELFGHEKGAFTGADRPATGRVEIADGGTLLLDEVGDLAEPAQARLLRFLDNGEYYRVGSSVPRRADVRVLAASNRPLRPAALSGHFRRDLFFRLAGMTIELPPLRERGGDLALLVDYFLARGGAAGMDGEARAALGRYGFPGNVRELRNIIEHAAAMAGLRHGGAGRQRIGLEHLGQAVLRPSADGAGARLDDWARRLLDEVLAGGGPGGFERLIARWEGPVLAAAMQRFENNQARLAAALGMNRSTLRKKLREHGMLEAGDGGEEQ